MSDYAQLMMRAVDRAAEVLEHALTKLDPEPPGRDELRARFQGIVEAPDMETAQRLKALFDRDFPGAFMKEQANAARR